MPKITELVIIKTIIKTDEKWSTLLAEHCKTLKKFHLTVSIDDIIVKDIYDCLKHLWKNAASFFLTIYLIII